MLADCRTFPEVHDVGAAGGGGGLHRLCDLEPKRLRALGD
jgi:hypothetical protein